jgi:hydrogenase/urease accessory protein HupE
MLIRNIVSLLVLWLSAQTAASHALGSSFLYLSEQSAGRFIVNWAPSKQLGSQADIAPTFPGHCKLIDLLLDCTPVGVEGVIRFPGLPLHADVVVRIEWLDGSELTQIIDQDTQSIQLEITNRQLNGDFVSVMQTYIVIGIEHILLGVDHLMFVVGLILLVGIHRNLIWTISAFTLAHSLTLGLSIAGFITVTQTPVEILIALSIVLVAAESMNRRETLARRYPWLIAFMFGLVHGLGFAQALREVGLPEHAIPVSLLAFNIGVELGQLIVVGVIYSLFVTLKSLRFSKMQYQASLFVITYALGGMGAYWAISRSAMYFINPATQ